MAHHLADTTELAQGMKRSMLPSRVRSVQLHVAPAMRCALLCCLLKESLSQVEFQKELLHHNTPITADIVSHRMEKDGGKEEAEVEVEGETKEDAAWKAWNQLDDEDRAPLLAQAAGAHRPWPALPTCVLTGSPCFVAGALATECLLFCSYKKGIPYYRNRGPLPPTHTATPRLPYCPVCTVPPARQAT